MANSNKRPVTDDYIVTVVERAATESATWYDSRLSRERQRVINYLNCALPKRLNKGSSTYVSSDVYDSVEAMKAQIVETFSANPDNLISFPPLNANDVESSREATEYCNHVFFAENDGFGIIQDVTHDGLTARIGVVKVYWEECKDRIEESFTGIPYDQVQGLSVQQDVVELEAEVDPNSDPQNPTFSGTLSREIDRSHVCVDVIAPEEFLIKPRARSIAASDYCGHRTLKTKAELKREGYDPKKVDSLHYDNGESLTLGPEVLAREAPIESATAVDDPVQEELEQVMVYESYIRMDLRNGKGVRLYKVCHAGGVLLSEPEEVDRAPFKAFVPLPVSHMFFGNNFAYRVVPTQNARTVLTRGILDHTAITTNPRWTVLKGGLLNPKEMLDNRLGGIVNINRPDAVEPLMQQNLNPFVFQTIEMLKANKEESTGISALSQGLNKDAISTQNSAALVDNLVTLSTQRQKIIARNFAKFLSQVYLEIYRLVLENQDKEKAKIIQVAGNFVPVRTQDWIERTTCKVALHLGYGERDRMTAKYDALYKSLAADPVLAPCFTMENRYNLATDGMKTGGFENFARYITPPQQIQPPQPDPIKTAEAKAKADTAEAALITAKASAQKTQDHAELTALKEQLTHLKHQFDAAIKMRAEDRKDAEVTNRIQISQREMALAEAAAPGKETDVVSPNA